MARPSSARPKRKSGKNMTEPEIDFDFKGNKMKIPKCLHMIKPQDVVRAIEMYYEGGVLEYNNSPIEK